MASTSTIDPNDEVTSTVNCSHCQKEATFMCSSCGPIGPRYCSMECQKTDWQVNHHKVCKAAVHKKRRTVTRQEEESNDIPLNDLSNQQQEAEEDDDLDDLKFYTNQVYRIIKPVVACIILSIFWVKVGFSQTSDYSPTRTNYVSVGSSTSTSGSTSTSTSSSIGGSFINAGIIIGQIIAVTVVIVFLFRKGWIKVLIGFFMIVVLMLLGFMTYLLLLNLIQVFFIPLDYITMVFALWNFAVVGLVSIFWKGPLWLQQSYLTMMSSLMAFSLTGLEQWTTWILLGLLAIWDLIAVLCPFGPLRLLIESSKTQQKEVPALLYSVNAVWFMMASADHLRLSSSMLGTNDTFNLLDSSTETLTTKPKNTIHRQSRHSLAMSSRMSRDGFVRLRDEHHQQSIQSNHNMGVHSPTPTPTPTTAPPENNDSPEPDEDDAERSGLKLGLGDFVFYSVLIARAAMYDWITTVCCTIAVLTGLTATIFLLAIYKKALPALPISIAFGMLFYFVAKTVLVPYISALCVFGMVGL